MSTSNQYISVRETAQLLSISEKKVMDMIEERKLQAYRIADKFLRLKKSDIQELRNAGQVKTENKVFDYTGSERVQDFFHFNDFYITSGIFILFLLYIIFYT